MKHNSRYESTNNTNLQITTGPNILIIRIYKYFIGRLGYIRRLGSTGNGQIRRLALFENWHRLMMVSFLDDIRKQPQYVREIMFAFCVIITVSLVGLIWFRSFEEDLFVMLNPEPEKQEQFYANRDLRTPLIYANVTKALGNMRAALYDAFGFLEDYNSTKVEVEEKYTGEVHKLPLSGDK